MLLLKMMGSVCLSAGKQNICPYASENGVRESVAYFYLWKVYKNNFCSK